MTKGKYILVRHFCSHSHVQYEFVQTLHEYGLVAIEEKENDIFIDEDDIAQIERMFRLHQDLGINFEGLDAISQLLKRIHLLEKDYTNLQKRLSLYE